MSYEKDRTWSDKYLPYVKKIVGQYLLEPSSMDEDCKHATDLIVLKARDMRIACRIRRPGYGNIYPHEFTIRSARDSGAETELSKIINGFGDWLFYGHAKKEGIEVDPWFIINLHSFRAQLINNPDIITYFEKSNGDGTHFVAFDIRSFEDKPEILIAKS